MRSSKMLFDGYLVSNGYADISYEMSKYTNGMETVRGKGKVFDNSKMTVYDQIHIGFKVNSSPSGEKGDGLDDVCFMYAMFRTRGILYLENEIIAERYSGIFGEKDIHGVFVMLDRLHIQKDMNSQSYSIAITLAVIDEPITYIEGSDYKVKQYEKYKIADKVVKGKIIENIETLNEGKGITFKILNKKTLQVNQYIGNGEMPSTIDEQIQFDYLSEKLDSIFASNEDNVLGEDNSLENLKREIESSSLNIGSDSIGIFEFVTNNNIADLPIKGKNFPMKQLLGIGSSTSSFRMHLDETSGDDKNLIQTLKKLSKLNSSTYKIQIVNPLLNCLDFYKCDISQIVLENKENLLVAHLKIELNSYNDYLDGQYINSDASASLLHSYGSDMEKPFSYILENYLNEFIPDAVGTDNVKFDAFIKNRNKFLNTVFDSNTTDGILADGTMDKAGAISRVNYSQLLSAYVGISVWGNSFVINSSIRMKDEKNSSLVEEYDGTEKGKVPMRIGRNLITEKPNINFLVNTLNSYNSWFQKDTSTYIGKTSHEFPGVYTMYDIFDTLGVDYVTNGSANFISHYSVFFDNEIKKINTNGSDQGAVIPRIVLTENSAYHDFFQKYNESFIDTILNSILAKSSLNKLNGYEIECARFIYREYLNNIHHVIDNTFSDEIFNLFSINKNRIVNGDLIREKLKEGIYETIKYFNSSVFSDITKQKFRKYMKTALLKEEDNMKGYGEYIFISDETFENVRKVFADEVARYQANSLDSVNEKLINIYFAKVLASMCLNESRYESSGNLLKIMNGLLISTSILAPFMLVGNMLTANLGSLMTGSSRLINTFYSIAYNSAELGLSFNEDLNFYSGLKNFLDEIFYKQSIASTLKNMHNSDLNIDFFKDMNEFQGVNYRELRVHPLESFFEFLESEDSFRQLAQSNMHKFNMEMREKFLIEGDSFNLIDEDFLKLIKENKEGRIANSETIYFKEEFEELKIDDDVKKKILGNHNVFSEIDTVVKATTEDYANIIPSSVVLLTKNSFRNGFVGEQRYVDISKIVGLTNIISMKINKDPSTKIETLELLIADNNKSFFQKGVASFSDSGEQGKTYERLNIENGDEIRIESLVYSNYDQNKTYSQDISVNSQKKFASKRIFNGFVAEAGENDGMYVVRAVSFASSLFDENFAVFTQDWSSVPNLKTAGNAIANGFTDFFRRLSPKSNDSVLGRAFTNTKNINYNSHLLGDQNKFAQKDELASSFNGLMQAIKQTTGYTLTPFCKTKTTAIMPGSVANLNKVNEDMKGHALSLDFLLDSGISSDQSVRLVENLNNIDMDPDIYGYVTPNVKSFAELYFGRDSGLNGSPWTLKHANNENLNEVGNSAVSFEGSIGDYLNDVEKFRSFGGMWDVRTYGDYCTLLLGRSNYFYKHGEKDFFVNPDKVKEVVGRLLQSNQMNLPKDNVDKHKFIYVFASLVSPQLISSEVAKLNANEIGISDDVKFDAEISLSDAVYESNGIRPFSKVHVAVSDYNLVNSKINIAQNICNNAKVNFDARFYTSENWSIMEFLNYERQISEISFLPGKETGQTKDLEYNGGRIALQRAQANEVASQILNNEIKNSYSGKIITTFNPDIQRGDKIFLSDNVSKMYGKFLVKSYEHTYSVDGCYTSINIEGCVTHENPYIDALGFKLTYKIKEMLINEMGLIENIPPKVMKKFEDLTSAIFSNTQHAEKLFYYFEKEAGATVKKKYHKIPFKSFIKFSPVIKNNKELVPPEIDSFSSLRGSSVHNWSFITEIPRFLDWKTKHWKTHVVNITSMERDNPLWKTAVSIVRFIDSVFFMDIGKVFLDNTQGRRQKRILELLNGENLNMAVNFSSAKDIYLEDGFYDGDGVVLNILEPKNKKMVVGALNIDYNSAKSDGTINSESYVDYILKNKGRMYEMVADNYDFLIITGFYTNNVSHAEKFGELIFAREIMEIGEYKDLYNEEGVVNYKEYAFVCSKNPRVSFGNLQNKVKKGQGYWTLSINSDELINSKAFDKEKDADIDSYGKFSYNFMFVNQKSSSLQSKPINDFVENINSQNKDSIKLLYLTTNHDIDKNQNILFLKRNAVDYLMEINTDNINNKYEYIFKIGDTKNNTPQNFNLESGIHDFVGKLNYSNPAFKFSREKAKPFYTLVAPKR